MKQDRPDALDPHGVPEHEWYLQERARLLARDGATAAGNAALDPYRRIAAALRDPPAIALPQGFAERVAHLAASGERTGDDRFERRLLRFLVAAMGLGAGMSAVAFGGDLVAVLAAPGDGAGGLGWATATAACLAVSWASTRPWTRRPSGPRRH